MSGLVKSIGKAIGKVFKAVGKVVGSIFKNPILGATVLGGLAYVAFAPAAAAQGGAAGVSGLSAGTSAGTLSGAAGLPEVSSAAFTADLASGASAIGGPGITGIAPTATSAGSAVGSAALDAASGGITGLAADTATAGLSSGATTLADTAASSLASGASNMAPGVNFASSPTYQNLGLNNASSLLDLAKNNPVTNTAKSVFNNVQDMYGNLDPWQKQMLWKGGEGLLSNYSQAVQAEELAKYRQQQEEYNWRLRGQVPRFKI